VINLDKGLQELYQY